VAVTIAYGASPDDIVDEVSPIMDEEASQMVLTQESSDKEAAKATIMAIVDLKSYAVAASSLHFYKSADDKHKNALFALIGGLSAKAPKDDIITQYGLVMGKLMKKSRGMFAYILGNINDSILSGESVVSAGTTDDGSTHYSVSPSSLGVQDKPDYITKLSLSDKAFMDAKDHERMGTGAKAIAAWISSGTANIYDKCVKKTMEKNMMKQANDDTECAKACEKVIHTAYVKTSADDKSVEDTMKTIQDLASTCRSGNWESSPASCKTTPPSKATVETACKAKATTAMQDNAKEVSMSTIEEWIEAKSMAEAELEEEKKKA